MDEQNVVTNEAVSEPVQETPDQTPGPNVLDGTEEPMVLEGDPGDENESFDDDPFWEGFDDFPDDPTSEERVISEIELLDTGARLHIAEGDPVDVSQDFIEQNQPVVGGFIMEDGLGGWSYRA